MNDIKEIRAEVEKCEKAIEKLIEDCQKKIGHYVIRGESNLKMTEDKRMVQRCVLNIDVFDSIPKPSKIITPNMNTVN